MTLETGALVDGRFSIDALLGEGGMGAVWSARHVVTEKRVALKVLKAASPELHKRLIREARVAAAVRHPNLVEVHDVLELEDGSPVLVMDLLEGETLAAFIERRGPLDEATSSEMMLQVVSAVAAAHAAGVVHRDLKPDNVFLRQGGETGSRVKVLDFGIAKLTRALGSMRHTAPALTQTGSVLGTPTYMAPEQVFGERDIDHRADVWSLGIILYECLAGRCPTEGENVGQIFKIISQRGFPSLARLRPDLASGLTGLVDRMLSVRVRERPSLREVATVLAAHAGLPCPELPSPAGSAYGDADPLPPPSSPSSVAHDETLAAPPDARARIRWGLAGATTVLVAALGWIAWGVARAEPEVAASAALVETGSAAPPARSPAPAESVASTSPPALQPSVAPSSASGARSAPVAQPRAASSPKEAGERPRTEPTALPGGVHADSPY
jgi:serine/threonine protein kinase